MKKNALYIGILFCCMVLLIIADLQAPVKFTWDENFERTSDDPYGTSILYREWDSFVPNGEIGLQGEKVDSSITQWNNFFVLRGYYSREDTIWLKMLFKKVEKGANLVLIGNGTKNLEFFNLKFDYSYNLNEDSNIVFKLKDSSENVDFPSNTYLTFLDVSEMKLSKEGLYYLPQDSSYLQIKPLGYVQGKPHAVVAADISYGEGTLHINFCPLIFTNYYLLYKNTSPIVDHVLGNLNYTTTYWIEDFEVLNSANRSPLRFINSTPALRWASLLALGLLMLYMAFMSKRKQRLIPIRKLKANTSLEFVESIGALYHQNPDHAALAKQKIAYFEEELRMNHHIAITASDERFVGIISKRLGITEGQAKRLKQTIMRVKQSYALSDEELKEVEEVTNFHVKPMSSVRA